MMVASLLRGREVAWATALSVMLMADAWGVTLEPGVSAVRLAKVLDGPGLTLENLIVSKGQAEQYGLFTNGKALLTVDSGVFMTTGNLGSVRGANTLPDYSFNTKVVYLDPNLAAISNRAKFDPAVLEMDVVPQGDRLNFVFAFGSEEYPEYVCSRFNDAFGLFVSGPGINGVQNAAFLPESREPIAVNYVNGGRRGEFAENVGCNLNNTNYFVDNGNGGGNPLTQMDGYTRPLRASITGLQPGQVYRVKLALADTADPAYDSGVFFRWLTSTKSEPVDLALQAAIKPKVPRWNSEVELVYTVVNQSAISTSSVQVGIELPPGMQWLGDDAQGRFNPASGIWDVDQVPAHGSRTIRLRAHLGGAGDYAVKGEIQFAFNEDPDSTPFNRTTHPHEDDTADIVLDGEQKVNNTPFVQLRLRAMLQGAYDPASGLMRATLAQKGFLPTMQPYGDLRTAFGYGSSTGVPLPFDYKGDETLGQAALKAQGNDAPVDWVLVELRDAADPRQRRGAVAALVQRDGDVVDAETGEAVLRIHGVADGSYYVMLRHRNHLAVMTAAPLALARTTAPAIDFAASTTPVYGGEAARKLRGAVALLWVGDANNSNSIISSGAGSDVSIILGAILVAPENAKVNTGFRLPGYYATDLSMDGLTIYTGANNDVNLLLSNIWTHPENSSGSANFVVQGKAPVR